MALVAQRTTLRQIELNCQVCVKNTILVAEAVDECLTRRRRLLKFYEQESPKIPVDPMPRTMVPSDIAE